MNKLIAAVLAFINITASANTMMIQSDAPFPTHETLNDACSSRSRPIEYKDGIVIVISQMHQCSNGDYVAESEVFEDIRYFKVAKNEDIMLFSSNPNFEIISPAQSLDVGRSELSATNVLIATYAKEINNKLIFDYQMRWPSNLGMDDTFNFQIAQSQSTYTKSNTIKYIEVTVDFYNAVDDKVKSKKFTGIGPVTSYGTYTFDSQFYGVIEYGVPRNIKITFMDGKTKSVSAASIQLKTSQQRFFNTNCWFRAKSCQFQRTR